MALQIDISDIPSEELQGFLEFREKVAGKNIDSQTLLATDYLNHFNEIVMMLEMIPDCPECLEEAKLWQPKTYQEHFRDSGFTDKETAIAAYDHVPSKFRKPFEETVEHVNLLVARTIERVDGLLAEGSNEEDLRFIVNASCRNIHVFLEHASAIIHGSTKTMDQEEIDRLMGA